MDRAETVNASGIQLKTCFFVVGATLDETRTGQSIEVCDSSIRVETYSSGEGSEQETSHLVSL